MAASLMPQQRQIVTTLDRPLFVSAGAGSGKTFTLTQRILWALSPESGPFVDGLDQVLAITFTRDAAAEIRERVRGALIGAGMAREALSVDDAWISTIHGMCARILRAHAMELGIDPDFGVLADAGELMDRAVDNVLARRQGEFGDLLSWYSLQSEGGFSRGTSVRDLVRRLLSLASSARHGFSDIRLVRGAVDLSSVRDAYQAAAENGSPGIKKVALAGLAAIDAYEASARTRADLAACMMACDAPSRGCKEFPKESVDWLKAELASAFVDAYLGSGTAMDELLELSRAVFDEYRALKRERSVLDNDDLLRLALSALRDHEGIRRAYEGRFKMVMIDEFQDTDQQQVDLIGYLAGEGGRALCTVGDAQQSIYRFRGAEVEVFRRQQRAIEGGGAGGTVVKLVRNFRSHASVLEYVARVFDDARGGIMPGFLDLEPNEGRKDGLAASGASRRQAFLVAGGAREDRTRAVAEGIARRFRRLADSGQPTGGMVVLLGRMTNAGVYAQAVREQGMDCVIAGGSVFSRAVEVRAVRALVKVLANPLAASEGLVPLLQSPLFALGAQEFLALATKADPETGETRRRNVEEGILSDDDAPGFGELPLLRRAREVLRQALSRVGRDSLAAIARDVVNESGWMVRLAKRGAEGRAVAANVFKALDALAESEAEAGRSPRLAALAFDRFLEGKQAPGALNEEGGDAVRIMTVHASKGLEFPIVAVAECFAIKPNSERLQVGRDEDGTLRLAALPGSFPDIKTADGGKILGADIKKRFDAKFLGGSRPWLTPELADEACSSASAVGTWMSLRAREDELALEERGRLLYVAMTRAREACILAMDAEVRRAKGSPLSLDDARDLTGPVLRRILPGEGASLDVDRLAFPDAQAGDFELVALQDFSCGEAAYGASTGAGEGPEDAVPAGEDAPAAAAGAMAAAAPGDATGAPDTFTLAWPVPVDVRIAPSPVAARDSYSYSSIASALHAEGEDRAAARAVADATEHADGAPVTSAADDGGAAPAVPQTLDVVDAGDMADAGASDATAGKAAGAAAAAPGGAPASDGDPTALGSAFHAAAQWLAETGARTVPAARRDAFARQWGVTPAQRARLDAALARWEASAIRSEALAWPLVRAEVPFFTQGSSELVERFGRYAEGAIDLLCTDPGDPSRALVIDYKTGGSPDETVDRLQEKHALQARVYADALHRAGYASVSLRFVRVEVPDPADPFQPQVVAYEL